MTIYKQYGPNYRGEVGGYNDGGTVTLNKCYYLKTEGAVQAIYGIEDSTQDVVQCASVTEITADILNANRTTITHEDEWKEWTQGEKYPKF